MVRSRPPLHVLMLGMEWFADRPGGLNRYFADLFDAMARRADVSSRAVVLSSSADPAAGVRGVTSMHRPLPWRLLALRRALAREAVPEVVNSHFALYALVLLTVRRLRRRPLVVNFQGPWAQESAAEGSDGRLVTWSRGRLERLIYSRAEQAIVLSETFRRVLVEDFHVLPARVHVIHPGVDLERFHPRDKAEARRRFDMPPDEPVVLAVRRLAARMGLDVLLQAWARLPRGLLVIAGRGHEMDALQRLAASLGLGPDRLRLLGAVADDDLPALYAASDLTVVPSLSLEGFGLVVLESLASGTPVLASATGGMAEVLPGLAEDLLVPPGHPDALAERVQRAFDDSDLPSPEQCRAFAEQFSWSTVSTAVVDVLARATRLPPERPLRVVYLVHSAALAGGELALVRLIHALDDVEAHVILGEQGPLVGLLEEQGISHEVVAMPDPARVRKGAGGPAAAVGLMLYALQLARRLRRLRPDLVHCNTLKANLYGPPAARLAGVPAVWHARDRVEPDYLPARAVRAVRLAARHAPSAVIANSEATLATLRLPPGAHAAVVPSPVPPLLDQRPRAAGPVRFLALGRLAPWKGQHLAIRAFAVAFPTGEERLHVVGGPLFGEEDYEDELRTLAQELGVSDRVDFHGHTDDVASVLSDAQVLVHSSVIPEPFGNVIVEGMAAGLAVVASDGGGPREVVRDRVDGLLTPLGDVGALAEAMAELRDDPALRTRLGQAAREAAARFAPDVIAPMVHGVYMEVLRRRQRTAH